MDTQPSENECALLSALQRVAQGSWEVLSETDILPCLEKKWVEFSPPDHYRLTEAGREALSRCRQRKGNPS